MGLHFSNIPSDAYGIKRKEKRGGGSPLLARLRYGTVKLTYRYLLLAELLLRPAIQGLRSHPLGVSARVADRPIHVDLGKVVKHGSQQHPASEAVTEGVAKPPQCTVFHQALTLAGSQQLLLKG